MKVLLTLNDVEPAVRLNAALEAEGVETAVVSPLDDMRSTLKREKPDAIVFSGDLTEPATVALVKELVWEGVACIGLVDHVDDAHLSRLHLIGYVDLYLKPVNVPEVIAGIRGILERRRLQQMTGLMGESEAMREVMVQIEQIAPVSSTVLIEGESGTGKELVARAIHVLSPRKNKPFIAVNVGALPETLLELADTGTIFLDEIGEIPTSTQVKLLRVLEEREFMRVGGTSPISVNVRVITATNQPLRELVESGNFRSDLFYRLNVLRIYLPPLRERPADIPVLVRRFIQEFATQHDRPFHGLSPEALQMLMAYPWPGNVRELRNLIESMVVLSPGHEIHPQDLPRQIREGGSARFLPVHVGPVVRGQEGASGRELEFIVRSLLELKLQVEEMRRRLDSTEAPGSRQPGWIGDAQPVASVSAGPPIAGIGALNQAPPKNVVTIEPGMTMEQIERAVIQAALRETRGNRRKAAEMLGIGERTLYRKIKEYKMPEEEFAEIQ
jgi:DNA-binding NtrC family response regulator